VPFADASSDEGRDRGGMEPTEAHDPSEVPRDAAGGSEAARVLVASSSRHGATREISEAIARTLSDRGLVTHRACIEDVADVAGFDAAIIGSAVHEGQWLVPARRFVLDHAAELARIPTWLYSSGPVGDPPVPPSGDEVDVAPLLEACAGRAHRVFGGRLDQAHLRPGERAFLVELRDVDGDYRDWDAITTWATEIADELTEDR
jgi:menaquinone-dependent protoporphyrinogen oxidase